MHVSHLIDSPLLIGHLRPVLLLPAGTSLAGDELDMVFAHELTHLRRADLWLGCVPALARHLFFFHPLAHLAVSEYGIAREAACDAAAVGTNQRLREDYARLLLKLGTSPESTGGVAAASPTFRALTRRLTMLQSTSFLPRASSAALLLVVAAAGVMPLRLVEAAATPANSANTAVRENPEAGIGPTSTMVRAAETEKSPGKVPPRPKSAPNAVNQIAANPTQFSVPVTSDTGSVEIVSDLGPGRESIIQPQWDSVTLSGEVRFPGSYPIRGGETLHELLQRVGGLTSRAFAGGSTFTRVALREREQKQLDALAERIQADISSLSLQAATANQAGASQALAVGETLLQQLKSSRAVGRLIIDLPGLMEEGKGSTKDVFLRDGDTLIVPPQPQQVNVIGEVQTVTSHPRAIR